MSIVSAGLLLLLLLGANPARAEVTVVTPAQDATVLGTKLHLELSGCAGARAPRVHQFELDGASVSATPWLRGAYEGHWYAELPLPSEGAHRLRLDLECERSRLESARQFTSRVAGTVELAAGVAQNYMARHPASKLAWNWGPAVFLYALGALIEAADPATAARAMEYLTLYHAHWARFGFPNIDRSDAAAPALSALLLARLGSRELGLHNALGGGLLYVKSEARNRLGAIDHLGHSPLRIFFPNSIWVDSLMMYAVLAAQWGNQVGEPELLEFGARQPLIFAEVLQDPRTGLFRHAWKVEKERAIPRSETFWLRGNGWVLVALTEILEELPPEHALVPRLVALLERTAHGLVQFQLPGGLWDTVANLPGYAYAETSGSALASYALARGAHRGWLPASYLEVAKKAFAGVAARLEKNSRGLSMTGISWHTNPSPRWLYKLTPQVRDAPYGVGPFMMAAAELRHEQF